MLTHGTVFWVTGLSGAGKSTLAASIHAELSAQKRMAVLLDGDTIRDLLLEEAKMDRESRLKTGHFNSRLCRMLAAQGIDVVCATISLFHEVQAENRKHLPSYVEILLKPPMETLLTRDSKQLYSRAASGVLQNVVGVDITPEWPLSPDYVYDTAEENSPEEMAKHIIDSTASFRVPKKI